MNASSNRRRAVAAITILAFTLAGCSNKVSSVPAGQTPSATAGTNPAAAPPAASTATSVTPAPPPTPAPAPPLTLPRGTRLEVRLDQTIDVKHVASGDRFGGTLAQPVVEGNTVAVPAGSGATGEVLVAHKRGKFKGRSMMALTLTRLDVNGTQYRIETGSLARSKKGKGKRSAAFIGGGAGMGMLIGGLATGGVGLLVGGLAGGGAGALGAAFTGNSDLKIPAETVVTFRLQDSLTLAPDTTQATLAP
jgi:glucose/arabinose dehydrogenase